MLLFLDLKNEKILKKGGRELEGQWLCKAWSYTDSTEQWGKKIDLFRGIH